jgi:hypothetical protein
MAHLYVIDIAYLALKYYLWYNPLAILWHWQELSKRGCNLGDTTLLFHRQRRSKGAQDK